MTKEFFITRFKHFSKDWKEEVKMSLDHNLDGFLNDAGFLGEYLGSLITGKDGDASAGAGFDLVDELRRSVGERFADEAKLMVNIRSWFCNPKVKYNKKLGCGKRHLFWNKPDTCSCGIDLTEKGGTGARAGIDAKAGIKYHAQMDKYIIQIIDPKINHRDCRTVIYKAFIIDAHDANFVEYMQYQLDYGSKNNCNLVGYSYDFYRASPIKLVELEIEIETNTISCIYFNLQNDKPELMTKKAMANVKGIQDTKEYLKNNNLLDKVGTLPASHFKLGKKSHGKARGITGRT